MKKIYNFSFLAIIMMFIMPQLIGMNNEDVVLFSGDISILSVQKSDLPYIRKLHNHYKKHKKLADNGKIINGIKYSSHAFNLLNTALKIRPDQFDNYYNALPQKDRILLIKASGKYNDNGKQTMFNCPKVTKRLIDVYFNKDLAQRIKKYFNDEHFVRAHFKKRLIEAKQLLLRPIITSHDIIQSELYLGSSFFAGYNSIDLNNYPVNVKINNIPHTTYAAHFGINNYEYRITDVNNNQCILWMIDHNNPDNTLSQHIQLKDHIKGCKLSSTKTYAETAIIYSENEMICIKINTQNTLPTITLTSIPIPENNIVVDVCFNPLCNNWIVGLQQNIQLKSIIKTLKNNELLDNINDFNFRKYGFLKKIIVTKNLLTLLFEVSHQHKRVFYVIKTDENYEWYYHDHYFKGLLHYINLETHDGSFNMIPCGNCAEFFDFSNSFYSWEEDQTHKDNNNNNQDNIFSWRYISHALLPSFEQPNNEIYTMYSPNGEFMVCNALKNKMGILCVETVLKDTDSHMSLLSTHSLYQNFLGVGFSMDGNKLIFLSKNTVHTQQDLLNDDDQKMLAELEKHAFTNWGVTSLLKQLCKEYHKTGWIKLHADDSTYQMLIDWSKKSDTMKQLLQKCLPIYKK